MTEISLWLDDYNDIFSDFDSRHYLRRRISEDFIDELKAALKFRPERPDALILLLPAQLRNPEVENTIVSSMQEQLRVRLETHSQNAKRIRMRGLSLLISGLLIMVADSIISYKGSPTYFTGLIKIILEPAGWFMIWTGLEALTYEYKSARKEKSVYETLGQASIHFKDA